MPQLATESFVSQYFWLFVTLCLFHYVVVNEVIPHISLTLKARRFEATSVEETLVNENISSRDNIFASSFTASTSDVKVEVPLNIQEINASSIKSLKL
jgi:hypothetical protein